MGDLELGYRHDVHAIGGAHIFGIEDFSFMLSGSGVAAWAVDYGWGCTCRLQKNQHSMPEHQGTRGPPDSSGGLVSVGALGECWEWLGNACLARAGILHSKIWSVVGRGLESVAERAVSGREAQDEEFSGQS
jgi:hypothetical protein